MPRNDGMVGRLEEHLQRVPGSKLIVAAGEHGPRYAYHLLREALALRELRRADMQPHLFARLQLLGARRGTGMSAMLEGLGIRGIGELDHGLLEGHGERAAQHLGQLSLAEITDLYTYFRYFGDFRIAIALRARFLDAHLREQEGAQHLMPSALAAALEQGEADRILTLVATKVPRAADRPMIREATAMAHALRGDIERAEQIWSETFSAQDRAFGRAVRDRTIAIVGPAPATADFASEIDSFDQIVRTNYQRTVDPRAGSRTDISYYNGNRLQTRREEICSVGPALSWLVAVRTDDRPLREMLPGHAGIRSGYGAAQLFLHAIPLAVPNILTDLIRFRPRRIKLFGVDFFTSQSAYGKGYHAHAVGSDAISHSIRVHEASSSFHFVQQMRGAGLCEADAIAGQVLDMTGAQYAARLQQVHGHFTVANENPFRKGQK